MALRVRDAVDGDMGVVAAIYAHHVLNGLASFELEPPSADEMKQRRAVVLESGYPYLVAEDNGAVVGYAYASAYRPRPAYRHTVEDTVYVGPGAERRGIGRTLLTELIRRCTAAGKRQMIAVIGDSGNGGSIGLHAALGFQRVGLLPNVGFKHGRWVDSVLMHLPLGAAESTPPEP